MTTALKAAVIGASGIGKQHAKWLHGLGVDVAAFVGSSAESTAKTQHVLQELFGFQGKGYWDADEMLAAEEPDLVVVSSPPALHKTHALAAIGAGAHVMCEKPIVWGPDPDERFLTDAAEMAQAARGKGTIFTVNTQYVAAVPCVREVYAKCEAEELGSIDSIFFEIESKGGGGSHEYEAIFADLAPHPISFLLAAVPGAQIRPETIECQCGGKETIITLECGRPDGGACHARFELRNVPSDAKPKRRFGFNDCVYTYEGRNDDTCEFRAYLICCDDCEFVFDDFVLANHERFVAAAQGRGEVLVSPHDALAGFDLQLRLHAQRRRV